MGFLALLMRWLMRAVSSKVSFNNLLKPQLF